MRYQIAKVLTVRQTAGAEINVCEIERKHPGMSRYLSRLIVASLLALPASASANGYFRYPSLHGDTVAFTAEGDLWTAPATGGDARRLTTNPGEETRAAISPDGRWVAFSAAYDGPLEAYVMPIEGGAPKRLTYQNGRAFVLGWTPSGEVLYTTQADSGPDGSRVVASVDRTTLARHIYPLADANDAVLSSDGKTLYFVRFGTAVTGDNVRHYRGGAMGQLWRYTLGAAAEAERIGPRDANLRRPMWWQGRLVVVSDQDGHDNLWSMLPDGSDARQLTHHTHFDVRSASLDQGRVVYQLGADLRLFDLAGGSDKPLAIHLVSDFQQEHERWLKQPLEYGTAASFAPDGKRVALTVRGHVVLAGEQKLRRVDIAQPAGSRVRSAVLSPDGRWVYAICDASGENEVWRFPADGSEGGKALTHDGDTMRWGVVPSPDGQWLAHSDKKGRLWLLDTASGSNRLIDDGGKLFQDEYPAVAWSPDSRNLAFVRPNSTRGQSQIGLYSLARKQTTWLTDDKYPASAPAFSPDGHWLYFLSPRHFQLANDAPWGDRNMGPVFAHRTDVYALALQAGERFPFASADELSKADTPAVDTKPAAAGKEAAKPALPDIQFDGLASRLYPVPVPSGDYRDLATDGSRLYLLDNEGNTLKTAAIDNKGAAPEVFMADVQDFALSQDGKKLFVQKKAAKGIGEMFIVEAGAKPPTELAKQAVAMGDWTLRIDPQEEWRQLFNDAWRMHRDYFFDPAMRGVDWQAIRARFAPLVERVSNRAELDDVLGQMTANVGALHSQVIPGDERHGSDVPAPAGLGAVFEREANGWRISHIYQTDPDLPVERSPLQAPGLDIREGDVVLAVNGRASVELTDFSDALRNQAGQQVLLSLARGPKQRWQAVVVPVPAKQQQALRYGDWEQRNKARVAQAGGGKLGYLHLQAMVGEDIASFAREFYAQYDRDGLIIDVRRNDGGNVDSWIIEKLLRRVWAFWQPRSGVPERNMQQTFRGHLAVLTDALTYSDGETFSAGIKALKLGPLVGERTAGAGVWLGDSNRLADHGMARVAEYPQFDVNGHWLIENQGVTPDVAVENPPHASFMGEDKQLDTAIALLMQRLHDEPVSPLKADAIPPLPVK
jgi:tricorn protease